jgi:hypothetical protein
MRSDPDLADRYPVRFIDVKSLGYDGTGASLRGFEFSKLKTEVERWMRVASPRAKSGYNWSAFVVDSRKIAADGTSRFDRERGRRVETGVGTRGRVRVAQHRGERRDRRRVEVVGGVRDPEAAAEVDLVDRGTGVARHLGGQVRDDRRRHRERREAQDLQEDVDVERGK